ADHRGDDCHRKRKHYCLIDAGHYCWLCQRDLNFEKLLGGCCTETYAGFDEFLVYLTDSQGGKSYCGRYRKDYGREDCRYSPKSEEGDCRYQVHEGWHSLHEVENRLHNLVKPVIESREYPDRDPGQD